MVDGPNVYAYVNNDPINYIDPMGTFRLFDGDVFGQSTPLMGPYRDQSAGLMCQESLMCVDPDLVSSPGYNPDSYQSSYGSGSYGNYSAGSYYSFYQEETKESENCFDDFKSCMKGFFIDGPTELIKGLYDLTPVDLMIEDYQMTVENPYWRAELLQEPGGWWELMKHDAMMIPGVKPTVGLVNAIKNYEDTWNTLKQSYIDAWNTPDGQGKIAFEIAGAAIAVLKAAKVAGVSKVGKTNLKNPKKPPVSQVDEVVEGGVKYFDGVPFKAGVKPDDIIKTPKGSRPDPSTYLDKSYIAKHLSKFDDGASYLVSKDVLEKYGKETIGRVDGQFVMPKSEMNNLLDKAKGNLSIIERELGIPSGAWKNKELVRIDIPKPAKSNIRLPSGNEAGANTLWSPGGKLPNGYSEAVINPVSLGNYVESMVKLK